MVRDEPSSTTGSSPRLSAKAIASATSLTSPAGIPRSAEPLDPGRRRCGGQGRLDHDGEVVAVRDPVGVGRRSADRSRGPGSPSADARAANCRSLPTAITRSRSDARNSAYGAIEGCALPSRARRLSGREGRGGLIGQRGEQAVQQVHLDPLPAAGALALPQRQQDPGHRVLPAQHVHERDPRLRGGALRVAGDRHQAADRLHEQVVPGQRRAVAGSEPGDRAVHDGGVPLPDRVVVQAETRHHAGPEVLHDDVGGSRRGGAPPPARPRCRGRARRSACCGSRCRSRWRCRPRRPAGASAGCRRRRAARS